MINIEQLYNKLKKEDPQHIFGKDPAATYRRYSFVCHPDICSNPLAKDCFALLDSLYESLNRGKSTPLEITVKSPKKTYTFNANNWVRGDLSTVYIGQDFYLKVPLTHKVNKLIQHEYKVISGLNDEHFKQYIPQLIEHFTVVQKNKTRLNCTTFKRGGSWYTLEQVMQQYKNGLDGRNFGWIFKRLLEVVSYIHRQNLVYTNATNSHYLINNQTHGGRLVDFTNCVENGKKPHYVSRSCSNFWPTELKSKKPLTFETDAYTVGMFGKSLLANDAECKRIRRYLDGWTIAKQSRRPNNIFLLYQEFDELLRQMYGQPKFVNLPLTN